MTAPAPAAPEPVAPDYGGACISSVVPALLHRGDGVPPWMPSALAGAEQVVLLVLDGLGWSQLQHRSHLAPSLARLAGRPVTSVAPSTTACAIASLTTGCPPGEHGLVGYRLAVGGGRVLNALRWRTADGDARDSVPPESLQLQAPFAGRPVPVVTRAEFAGTGFTDAAFGGTRLVGWRQQSSIAVEVGALLGAGEPLVWAYYDGVDKVAHAHGLGPHYDAELVAADRLVGDLLDVLPPGAALVVTSDHGQVHVGDAVVALDDEVLRQVDLISGEGRFLWLHARPGRARTLAGRLDEAFADVAWVRTRDEVVDAGWLGPSVLAEAADRLGDVALVAHAPVAFLDPADTGSASLVSRHGSLTPEEMLVPLLAGGPGFPVGPDSLGS